MKKTIAISLCLLLVLTFIPFISATEEQYSCELPIREINPIHKPIEKAVITQSSGSNLREDLDKYKTIKMTIPTFKYPYRWFRYNEERVYLTVNNNNKVTFYDKFKKPITINDIEVNVQNTNFKFMKVIELKVK